MKIKRKERLKLEGRKKGETDKYNFGNCSLYPALSSMNTLHSVPISTFPPSLSPFSTCHKDVHSRPGRSAADCQ